MDDDFAMTALSSSNVAAAGYSDDTKTLRVEFSSGGLYDYANVPRDYYEGLISSNSPGGYFARNIRDSFRYTRVS